MLRSRSQTQSPGVMARPVSITIPTDGTQAVPNTSTGSTGDRHLDYVNFETPWARLRVLGDINSIDLDSSRLELPLPVRASGAGTSRVDPIDRPTSEREASLLAFLYDNVVPVLEDPERLALIWHKIRA